jgi:hypothetical protein
VIKSVREFLVDIAENEIISGKKYSCRIEVEDGGDNSYISVCVYANDFQRRTPVIEGIRLFRHSNSVNNLVNTWSFSLGNVCHLYADEPNILLEFSSYGKCPDEAETEAKQYFSELKKLIRKQTSAYKVEAAESAREEKEKLLERLKELEATP